MDESPVDSHPSSKRWIDFLLKPRGIAVIGASAEATRIGGEPIRALVQAGYSGRIYPVNPRREIIAGLRCYPSAADIDGICDLAIIAVPAAATPEAVRQCGLAGIPLAIILSAGFRETGEDGAKLESELKQAAKSHNVRLIGPNCQGAISVEERVFAAFGSISHEVDLPKGSVSMVFQSGGFGFSIVLLCAALGIGFRTCISTGNETDIATPEILSAFLEDEGTNAIFSYLEGASDGLALMAAGRRSLELRKPIFIWKGGASEVGARAAGSHTANLMGRHVVYQAAFRQSGMIEVSDVEDIADLVKIFANGREPRGNAVGVLGISGGSGIVFADAALAAGLRLPPFSESTAAQLRAILPKFASAANPADVTANIFNNISILTETIGIVLRDESIDQLCLLLASLQGNAANLAAEAIAAAARSSDKPISVAWSAPGNRAQDAYALLGRAGIPIMPTPVRLAKAAGKLAQFAAARRRNASTPAVRDDRTPTDHPGAGTLSEADGKRLLERFGIPITRQVLAPLDADIVELCRELTFPVAVKVASRDILHKTEVDGVRLGVQSGDALRRAAHEVLDNARRLRPDAVIDGVLAAEMASGVEMLAGVVNDPTFGPTVAFGLGGIFTEILRDVAYRIAPFNRETAMEMIDELRARPIFEGVRGGPALDIDATAAVLVKLSEMAAALGARLVEMDINPLFVRPRGQGVVAADAVIVLSS